MEKERTRPEEVNGRKIFKKGDKVRVVDETGWKGEVIGVIQKDAYHLVQTRQGEEFSYLVHFLAPAYDTLDQGPFGGAMILSRDLFLVD